MFPADRVAYRYDGKQVVLLVDGQERIAQPL